MYYIDRTRYDQVDGTGPVVPSVKEDGTRYLVPSSCSPEHQVYQVYLIFLVPARIIPGYLAISWPGP